MRFSQLTRPARAYLLTTYALAIGLVVMLLPRDPAGLDAALAQAGGSWFMYVALLLATTLAHSFPVHTPNRQSYYVSLPFFAASLLLVPPLQFVVILILPNLVEWKRQSRSWPAQAFNVAAYVITGLAAQAAYFWLRPTGSSRFALDERQVIFAAIASVLVFLSLNRALVSGAIALANRLPPFGRAELESVLGESLLLMMGLPLAWVVQTAPWALVPASAPLLLAYRALEMPHMRAERRHDELTGLFTMSYLLEACDRELSRARRFRQPLGMLLLEVCDFDAIGATYGRQASDIVIRMTAQALSHATRDYDVAAYAGNGRFGLLLPEASSQQALMVARRLQATVAAQQVEIPTRLEPLRTGLRVGIATRAHDADTPRDLIEAAEVALTGGTDSPLLSAPHRHDPTEQAHVNPEQPPLEVTPEPAQAQEPVLAEPQPHAGSRTRGLPRASIALQFGLALVTLAVVISTAPGLLLVDPWATLWMVGFVGVAELLGLELSASGSSYSISTVPIIAAGLLLGPAGALVVAPTGMLLRAFHYRTRWYKALFNVNTHIVAAIASTWVFHLVAPALDVGHLAWLLAPSVLAGGVFYLHTVLIAVAMGTELRVSPVRIWLEHFRWLWMQYIVLGLMGLLLAVAYQAFGLLGAAIFVVPPMMMRHVAKQYLDRSMDHVRQLRALNQHLASEVDQRKQSEASLEHQALHDALTDLPNRVLLRDRTQQALLASQRDGQSLVLMLLDLDRFKEVNDTLGHHVGDLLLKEAACRFQTALRESDTIARLGGDEFAALLPTCTPDAAIATAQRLLAALDSPFHVEGSSVDVRASIGIAPAESMSDTPEGLLRRADVAMYRAKRGGTGYALYAADEDQNTPEHLALTADLRRAIAEDQLELHYQPKLDLRTRRIHSVEALVRWRHPQLGLLSPSKFIPLAESVGLIDSLSEWVVRTALDQCRLWREAGLDLAVAVNLSVRNLHDATLPDSIAGLLGSFGIVPESLILEITESTLMAEPERALETVRALRRIGVRMSIDDFGTGYSSLIHLKQLPVDELKIDQAFVRHLATNANDAAIVRSTIALAHELGLTVVAEGVEERRVFDLLTAHGCDVAQGYYIGRPVVADQLASMVRGLTSSARGLPLAA